MELDAPIKRENLPVGIVPLLHDGIWFTCPHDTREKAKALIRQVMENSVALSVPLMVTFD